MQYPGCVKGPSYTEYSVSGDVRRMEMISPAVERHVGELLETFTYGRVSLAGF